MVSSVIDTPCASKHDPPTRPSSVSKRFGPRLFIHAISFLTSAMTSGPMPSPGRRRSLKVAMSPRGFVSRGFASFRREGWQAVRRGIRNARMTALATVLAFSSAFCFGLGLVLTQIGLRDLTPLAGAAISIPSSTLLFVVLAPVMLAHATPVWPAAAVFAAVGLVYPGVVTLMTFEANRVLGPVITGALGNLAPLFAVAVAVVLLAEPLRALQLAGILAIVAGVVVLTLRPDGEGARWRTWYLLLPLVAAAMRGL